MKIIIAYSFPELSDEVQKRILEEDKNFIKHGVHEYIYNHWLPTMKKIIYKSPFNEYVTLGNPSVIQFNFSKVCASELLALHHAKMKISKFIDENKEILIDDVYLRTLFQDSYQIYMGGSMLQWFKKTVMRAFDEIHDWRLRMESDMTYALDYLNYKKPVVGSLDCFFKDVYFTESGKRITHAAVSNLIETPDILSLDEKGVQLTRADI